MSITSRNINQFSKLFHCYSYSAQNYSRMLQKDHYMFHHTLETLPHYPMKP